MRTLLILVNTKTQLPQAFTTDERLLEALPSSVRFVDMTGEQPLILTDNGMFKALDQHKAVHVFDSEEDVHSSKRASFKIFSTIAY
jgi:hypothetical protein